MVVEAKGEALTVHEFMSAVHPWLMDLREEILAALELNQPLPADTKLMVNYPWPAALGIDEEENWERMRKKHPQHYQLAAMSYEPVRFIYAPSIGD